MEVTTIKQCQLTYDDVVTILATYFNVPKSHITELDAAYCNVGREDT